MNNLVRSLLIILIVSSVGTSSYSDVTESDDPAILLFRVCRDAGADVRDAVEPLLGAGWKNVTSEATWQRVITERIRMVVRAKLSQSSYPEPWDDATVRRSYPSTMAQDLDDLVAHVHRNVQAEMKPFPPRTVFVLAAPSGEAMAAILHYPNSLVCEIIENSEEDPTLRDEFYHKFPQAREKGAIGHRFYIDNRGVAIVILSPHAQQRDKRFPVDFNMSVWMRFEKDAGKN